jgi:hypothetical protein
VAEFLNVTGAVRYKTSRIVGRRSVSKTTATLKRGRIAAASLARRLTGFSLPILGVQWTPPPDEREIIRKLIAELEDRRVLYVPHHLEVADHVTSSVMQLREALTKTLQALPETSSAAGSVRAMRAACRKFLQEPRPEFSNLVRHRYDRRDQHEEGGPSFFVALGELRASCGAHIAALAYLYELDVEVELASILPALEEK